MAEAISRRRPIFSRIPYEAFNPDGRVARHSGYRPQDRVVDLRHITLPRIGKRLITPRLSEQPSNQTNADLSPDGKWIAYQSNESGRDEIYVRALPVSRRRTLADLDRRGTRPVWARNGRELFYLDGTLHLVAVPVQAGATFNSGSPAILFELPSTPTATARTV